MSSIITGLFDSHVNGVDLLWVLILIGLLLLVEYANRRHRRTLDRARDDLETAPGIDDWGFDMIFVDPRFDPSDRVMLVDLKTLPADQVTIDTQGEVFYEELARYGSFRVA